MRSFGCLSKPYNDRELLFGPLTQAAVRFSQDRAEVHGPGIVAWCPVDTQMTV